MEYNSEFFVIAFDSTSHSMQAERLAVKSFKISVIPTPAEISSNCGLAIRFIESHRKEEIIDFARRLTSPCVLYALTQEKKGAKWHVRKIEL